MSSPALVPPPSPVSEVRAGDHTFQVRRLKVKDSLRGLKLVGKVLLPAIAEAHGAPAGQLGSAVERVVEGLDCLPELLDLFAANSKVFWAQTGSYAELLHLVDQVFAGRPDWVVLYLSECVKLEYGGFLAAGGPFGNLLAKATPALTPQQPTDASTSPTG